MPVVQFFLGLVSSGLPRGLGEDLEEVVKVDALVNA